MDLTSPLFLFAFLPLFMLVYLISSPQIRLYVVVAASIVFLTLGQSSALLWLGGILIAGYALGRAIARARNAGHTGKAWLILGIGLNIVLLSFFKILTAYGSDALRWLQVSHTWIKPIAGLAVPLGLSFVTFQAISYLVDVWRGRTRTNKLVFFEDESADRRGQLAQVKIDKTGPWSMSGTINN